MELGGFRIWPIPPLWKDPGHSSRDGNPREGNGGKKSDERAPKPPPKPRGGLDIKV